jgi:hypothetical protein
MEMVKVTAVSHYGSRPSNVSLLLPEVGHFYFAGWRRRPESDAFSKSAPMHERTIPSISGARLRTLVHLELIIKGLPYVHSATICTETEITPVSARIQVVTEAEVAAGVAAMCNGSGGGTEEIVRRILEAGLAASRVVPGALPATGDELPPAIEARLKVWLTLGAGLNPHTMNLVVRFARALAKNLADAETKYGYSDGWRSPEWMDECRVQLQEHVAKGDPRDVAAYCAFLWHHGASTTTPPNATVFSASEQG